MELTRDADDPLAQELLVHAMLDRSSLGSRLRAVSLAADAVDAKVREALVFAMLNDPSLPVRLRALEAIAVGEIGPTVQDALLKVLEHDESIQMRLLAVQLLTEGGTQQQSLLRQTLRDTELRGLMTSSDLVSVTN